MGENLTIIIGVLGFTTVVMSPFIINRIIKFKLELEKMRIEADVRKEEIRCRNQLELDKFMSSRQEDEAAHVKQHGNYGHGGHEKAGGEAGGAFEGTRSGKQMDAGGAIMGSNSKEHLKY